MREHGGRSARGRKLGRRVALAQAAYFVATGLWPLVSIESFERVTGPKADRWLAQTVGVLVATIGAAIGLAGARRTLTPELRLLALASAVGLAGVDLVFVARRRIAPIYLADAAVELVLAAGWLAAPARRPRLDGVGGDMRARTPPGGGVAPTRGAGE
jgi:hypothetical protein